MAPARLTSGLLARKGRAQPSGGLSTTIDLAQPLPAGEALRRAGAALRGPVAEILVPVWRATPAITGRDRPGGGAPVSLTVRIDRTMHTRLRVLAARQQSTNQDIVRCALDAYLELFGAGCACLGEAKPKG